MAIIEQFGSREVRVTRQGITGRRAWHCTWAERLSVVKINQPFPGEPLLRCADITYKPIGVGTGKTAPGTEYNDCLVTAEYSTYQNIDDAPEYSYEFGGEILETGLGRVWRRAGTPVEQAMGVFYPQVIQAVTLTMASVPTAAIFNNLAKVNATSFEGAPAGTLLFEGATIESRFDYERQRYIYRCTFRFLYRPVPHNYTWRAPRQKRNQFGELVWDSRGFPVYEDGPAGIGGWDKMLPELYGYGDFNSMLGRPGKPLPPVIPGPSSKAADAGYKKGDEGYGGSERLPAV